MKAYPVLNTIPANTVMNKNLQSKACQLYQGTMYSFQVVFTGTPTGAFFLEASSDPYPAQTVQTPYPINWSVVANSTFNVSAAGDCMWTVQFPGYNWVRVCYTDSSSGDSTAIITSSTFNGKE